MINSKSITKLINAKRLEHQAITEMLPENIRKQSDRMEMAAKEIIKGVLGAVLKDSISADTDENKSEEKPHRVDIKF